MFSASIQEEEKKKEKEGDRASVGQGNLRYGISNLVGFVVYFELLGIFYLLGSSNEEDISVRRSRVGKGRFCQIFPKTLSELFGHILA